jgi:hypothetical protein
VIDSAPTSARPSCSRSSPRTPRCGAITSASEAQPGWPIWTRLPSGSVIQVVRTLPATVSTGPSSIPRIADEVPRRSGHPLGDLTGCAPAVSALAAC